MARNYWWIKERHNPQFKKPYFILSGQMTIKEAKQMENPIYGENYMHKFSTKKEYEKRIQELRSSGVKL